MQNSGCESLVQREKYFFVLFSSSLSVSASLSSVKCLITSFPVHTDYLQRQRSKMTACALYIVRFQRVMAGHVAQSEKFSHRLAEMDRFPPG